MLVFKNLEEFRSIKGKGLPTGEWYTVTQQMINDFANATLDKQWIHVDEERAAKRVLLKVLLLMVLCLLQ